VVTITPDFPSFTAGSIPFTGADGRPTQDNANFFFDDNANTLGVQTSAPTHALTVGSGGKAVAFAVYNTVDQVTNYERIVGAWSGNIFSFLSGAAGTGTVRNVSFGTTSASIIAGNASPAFAFNRNSGGIANFVDTSLVVMNSAGSVAVQTAFAVNPTINQSATSGYTALDVNPSETATGSGAKSLQTWRVGSSQKSRMDNAGQLIVGSTAAPTSTLQSGGSFATALRTVAVDTTLLATDCVVVFDCTSGAKVATLPTAVGIQGRRYDIPKSDGTANTLTIDANGSETIGGALTQVLSARGNLSIVSDNANWIIL
jgi:hypothetical protein